MPEEVEQSSELLEQPPLGRATRVLLAVLGTSAIGAGAVAVFVTDNGAGTVALITLGGFLLFLAASGQRVTHAKIGDNEIRLARLTSRLFEVAPASERAVVAEQIVQSSAIPEQYPRHLYAQARAVLYQREVWNAIKRVVAAHAGRWTVDLFEEAAMSGRRRADILMRVNNRELVFEIKSRTRPLQIEDIDRQLFDAVQLTLFGRKADVLIVSNVDLGESARERVHDVHGVHFIRWESAEDDDSISRALDQIVNTWDPADPPG